EKLPHRILGTVEVLAQEVVKEMTLKEALRASDRIADFIAGGLKERADIASLGIEVLGVSVRAVKPTPDTAKALEAEAREAILKNADEAIFARRNFAVEQERAIRESELDTEIAVEQKKRSIRETQMDAEASVAAKKNELREAGMVADITLEGKRKDFGTLNAENPRPLADAEAYRVGALMKIFEGVDTRVIQALASAGMQPGQLIAQAFSGIAEKAEKIGQLNVSPDLLQSLMEKPKLAETVNVRRQCPQGRPGPPQDPAAGPGREIPDGGTGALLCRASRRGFLRLPARARCVSGRAPSHRADAGAMGPLPGHRPQFPAELH